MTPEHRKHLEDTREGYQRAIDGVSGMLGEKPDKLRGLIYDPMSDVWMAFAVIVITLMLLLVVSRAQGQTTRPAPAFITAVFQQPVSSFSRWKSRGINTVINTVSGVGQDVQTDSEYVNAAHAANLYVIADAPGADCMAQRDEADGNGVPAVTTFAKYQAWKQANPAKLVYMNLDGRRRQFTQLGTYRSYFQGADWCCLDRYPVSVGAPQDIPLIAGDIETMKAAAPGKRLLYILECGDQHLQFSPWLHSLPIAAACRPPTLAELKQEIALCVSHGVTGIGFFTHDVNGNVDPATGIGGWKSFDSTTPEIAAALPGICASLTGVPIVTPPTAPRPPAIIVAAMQPMVPYTAPRLAKRTRVLTTGNPTLVKFDNFRWVNDGKGTSPDINGRDRRVYNFDAHDEMVALGYEEAFMVGNAELNHSPMWAIPDAAGNPQMDLTATQDTLDDSLTDHHDNPPTRYSCLAIGQLINRPQTFRPNGVKPHAMVIFDIESSPTINSTSVYSPLKDRLAAVNGMTQAVKWVRQSAGPDQEVAVYDDFAVFGNTAGPESEITAAQAEFNHQISCRAASAYCVDWQVENPGFFQSGLAAMEHSILRFSPEHANSKLVILCPVYGVYNRATILPGMEKMDGVPIPMELWKNIVDLYVDRGYSILVWTGNTKVELIREQFMYAAGYQRK